VIQRKLGLGLSNNDLLPPSPATTSNDHDRGGLNLIHQPIDEMDSIDLSADLTVLPMNQTARLLSESPLIEHSSHPDLSESDLLSAYNLPQGDRKKSQAVDDEHDEDEVEEGLQEGEGGEGEDEEAQIRRARKAARTREEKLQNDLFLLKKLNSAFSLYTDALRATQSSTEVGRYHILTTPVKADLIGLSFWYQRLKARLKDTNALLDRYIGMLDRSEAVTKLILDEKWQGSSVVCPPFHTAHYPLRTNGTTPV